MFAEHETPVLDLTISNPTKAGLGYPHGEIIAALAALDDIEYSPDPKGLKKAREAIAGYYAERGRIIDPDRLLLTSGTSEAYSFLFKLLCDSEDRILVPLPGYPLFEFIGLLEQIHLDAYDLRAPTGSGDISPAHWSLDANSLERNLFPNTRAIVVVQPGNPTGSVFSQDEAVSLLQLSAQRDVPIIVDEVFSDYCHPTVAFTPLQSDGSLVFTLNGISKILGMPQLKLSWIYVDGDEPSVTAAMNRLEIVADTFLSVGTPVQRSLPALFEIGARIRAAISERLAVNLRVLSDAIGSHAAVAAYLPEGGWYAVLRVTTTRPGQDVALELLRRHNVHIHPGAMFGFDDENHLVLSLLTPSDILEQGLARLVDFLDDC